jgi:hypothetical protein
MIAQDGFLVIIEAAQRSRAPRSEGWNTLHTHFALWFGLVWFGSDETRRDDTRVRDVLFASEIFFPLLAPFPTSPKGKMHDWLADIDSTFDRVECVTLLAAL